VIPSLRDKGGAVIMQLTANATRRLELRSRVRRAAKKVHAQAPRPLEAALDYAYSARPGLFDLRPIQVRSELHEFLLFVQELKPRAIVEIGTSRGGTLFLFTRVAAPDAYLISIDLATPGDRRFGGGDFRRRRPLFDAFALDEQRIMFLVGDSHLPDTRRRVDVALQGREVDLLFIDGDHTFEGVKADYELYADLVRAGGAIAFHDIVDGPHEFVGGVPDFWRSIRGEDSIEFVRDPGQGGYGIGVLRR
jgi:cephalosporin hydroxylase